MAFGDQWDSKKWSACRGCGQTEKKHSGFGLCQACYRQPEVLAWAKANRDNEIMDSEKITKDSPIFDSGSSESFSEPLVEEPVEFTGERRPGSFTSPVGEPGDEPFTGERPNTSTPQLNFGKLGDWFQKKTKPKKPPVQSFATKEKAPRGVQRRISAAGSIEDAWTGLGGVAVRTGRHAPLGRYLQWQAPAAGEMLDQALAGTIVDRKIFQPAVRVRGRLDLVGAVVGPPAIILAIERNPQNAQMLIPLLKASIRSSLPTMLPAMKKAQAREEKVTASLKEMFPDIPEGVDPVDLVIEQLFAGYIFSQPEPTMEYTPEEEPVHNAQSTT
jgi:hypothetical protein